MKKFLITITSAVLLTACGGGGSDATNTASKGVVDYVGAAAAGEFVNFIVDTDKSTYEYEIIASQFGQKGTKVQGIITANSDGSYTQGDGKNSHMRISPSGLMLGVVTANLFNENQQTLFIGATNTIKVQSEVTGYYNFISRMCTAINSCIAYYGTMEFANDGTWTLCSRANLAATPRPGWILQTGVETDCMEYETGTYELNGNAWNLIDTVRTSEFDEGSNPQIIGSAIFKETGGVNALVIDWRDNRPTYPIFEGNGFLVGTTQTPKIFANTGKITTFDRYGSDGRYNTVQATDTGVVYINGFESPLVANEPWSGFYRSYYNGNVVTAGLTIGDSGVTLSMSPTTETIFVNIKTSD